MRISVIGGDLRQKTVYSLFALGFEDTALYGFEDTPECPKTCKEGDIAVLPMPVTFDGENINAPFCDKKIPIREVVSVMKPHSVLFGGKIPDFVINELADKNVRCFDYLKREELAIKNAVPTAEGAIELAMAETPFTLCDSRCLVIGFGRIGKVLCEKLRALGARVTVSARKYPDLAMIGALNCRPLHIRELYDNIGAFDVIFNTVPAPILDRRMLGAVHKDSLIIDLASKPGGVDFPAAKELQLKIIWALSLPGKVAPLTSGRIIHETIVNILNELEV